MGLYVQQSDDRSELQKRLAAELQEKAKKRVKDTDLPDGVADSNYLENTTQTTKMNRPLVIVIILVSCLIILFAIQGAGH